MNEFQVWDRKRLGATLYGSDDDIALYERHNDFVRNVVPKERMLEFEPKMGWKPLCEFLDVPIPKDSSGKEIPYPNVNDSQTMSRRLTLIMTLGLLHWAALLGALWWVARTFGPRV